MFGIGMTELLVILVIGLLVLGPRKLPELARSLGRGLAEFRRASTDMRREFLEVDRAARIDDAASAEASEASSTDEAAGDATEDDDPGAERPTGSTGG
jgi:Tat protein translocase TatB subunit